MKKLVVLLLALTLLLTGCVPSIPTEEHFNVTVADATEALSAEASDLSVNVFANDPDVLDVKDGVGYSYLIVEGVRIALYGNDDNMLTSVYLQLDKEVADEDGEKIMQAYSDLVIAHFTPADELEGVTRELSGYTEVDKMITSTASSTTSTVSMSSDGTVTYVSVLPPALSLL